MLTVQHLSRLGPQGAIVSKGAGPPPLVTGRRVKPIIGEAWEIQYRVGRGRGRGLHHCGNQRFHCQKSMSRLLSIAWCCVTPFLGDILAFGLALIGPPCPPSPAAPAMWPGPLGIWSVFDTLRCILHISCTNQDTYCLSLKEHISDLLNDSSALS